jgi:post-segregation antitoxin (ccd killing protein)
MGFRMSTIKLKLPDSLHATLRELAKKERVSVSQFVTVALAEKISALMTEEYLEMRAARGERTKFDKAMAKVADIEPEEQDRL